MPPPRIERGLQVPETCVISFSPRGPVRRRERAIRVSTGAPLRSNEPSDDGVCALRENLASAFR